MKRLMVLSLVVLAGIFVIDASIPATSNNSNTKLHEFKYPGEADLVKPVPGFGKIPLYFIPNQGQVHEQAKFYARTSRYTLWLTKKGLVFDRVHTPASGHPSQEGKNDSPHSPKSRERDVARMVFLDSNRDPGMVPVDMTPYKVNYIKGNEPSTWHTGIPTSKAVLYKNIYNDVDLKVYGIEKQIEYDWIIKPGGDPGNICFQYKNVKGTRIDEKGNLIIETHLGELIHRRPVSYQEVSREHGAGRRAQGAKQSGKRMDVDVKFKKIGENTYGFEVGKYDRSCELVIDPVVMAYSTYLGGSGDEYAYGLAVDSSGCAYVTGDTTSTDFPTLNSYQTDQAAADAFVTKFSSSGNSLIYSTFLGGSSDDRGLNILVDDSGQAYVVGWTESSNFPTKNAYQATYGGGSKDVFVAILSSSGSSLAYSTFLGGNGDDRGYDIALDSSKNIYIAGRINSTNFPTKNAYQGTFGGGNWDASVTKIDSSGSSLVYSTYLGGSGRDIGTGIAVNGSTAYIAGRTTSTDFPTHNQYQGSYGGGEFDAFVTKLSSSGSSLVYSTFLGGDDIDAAYGIAVDSSGSAYVAGDTSSTNFPTKNAYQSTHGGGDRDAYVTKFSSTGTTLEYSTFLGGGEWDTSDDLTINSAGNAHVIGSTKSSNFPVKRAYQSTYNGDFDVFVSMFSTDGTGLSFSTYLGGGDNEYGRGVAVDSSGNIYAAGYTASSDFPTENAYQNAIKGDVDAFVAKFSTTQFGTLCEGVDNCNLTWTTGGSADWFEQTDTYYYDDDAVQSGDIGNSQSTYIKTTIIGPGQLSFWWNVSSESYYDYLSFYIDDKLESSISGLTSWEQRSYPIPAGTHTLKWVYEKDSSFSYGSDCGWVDKVEFTASPEIVLNRTQLTFGLVMGTTTPDQMFSISNATSSTLNWTASTNKNWLSCSPTSGTGESDVTVSIDPTGLTAGTHTGTITVSDPIAPNSPQTVSVTLNVYGPGASSPPFGAYDTPTDQSTIRSSVPFTGWVLDDVGVVSVKIYRQNGAALTYIGDAVLVEGARPDVEQAYPDYPNNYKAGWGYMMLTNFLPNGGNGTFIILAIATDVEGHQVTLDSKTVLIDNASAVKPFGAIDTPTQGGTASGTDFINWGWVLTPQPNYIPTNGSTINVYVDGVNIGNPTYNNYRPDIATLFPGYANTNGAVGYFYLDTTAFQNGVHTIQWTATDSGGNTDGIGSRYFKIQNIGSSPRSMAQSAWRPEATFNVEPSQAPVDDSSPIQFKKGYQEDTESKTLYPDDSGMVRIEIKELERVEFRFGRNRQLSGWMLVGDRFRPL
nr:hypothetical protein [Candidatus Aminicenantes bacterium]NIM81267.1 hypothetical protein [Candidatus Aminicenantes bacterium]NIN20666.1 hypothetical protein [Candidatus Aminicenantes bacterium]NIN44445.1 hypothetical protein [Candidatus Aminicenantes bacterium]NIN87264.1 hypothetical protein [Candidatus Aminicenantes bacterium]